MIFARVREFGADVALEADGGVSLVGYDRLPADLINEARLVKSDLRHLVARRVSAKFGSPSPESKFCKRCRRLARCYDVELAGRVCGPCLRSEDQPPARTPESVPQSSRHHDRVCRCGALTEHFKVGGSYDSWLAAHPDVSATAVVAAASAQAIARKDD